jgi:hypothetical protein
VINRATSGIRPRIAFSVPRPRGCFWKVPHAGQRLRRRRSGSSWRAAFPVGVAASCRGSPLASIDYAAGTELVRWRHWSSRLGCGVDVVCLEGLSDLASAEDPRVVLAASAGTRKNRRLLGAAEPPGRGTGARPVDDAADHSDAGTGRRRRQGRRQSTAMTWLPSIGRARRCQASAQRRSGFARPEPSATGPAPDWQEPRPRSHEL